MPERRADHAANLFGLSNDLGLNPTQYALCLALFFLAYVAFVSTNPLPLFNALSYDICAFFDASAC